MDDFERDEIQNMISFGGDEGGAKDSDTAGEELENTKIIKPIEPSAGITEENESPDKTFEDGVDTDSDGETEDADIYSLGDIDEIDLDGFDDIDGIDEIDLDGIDDLEDFDDFEDIDTDAAEFDEETGKKPKSKRFVLIRRIIAAIILVCFAYKFITTDTGLIGIYKKNFAHNCTLIAGHFKKAKTLMTEKSEDEEDIVYSLESENVPETDTSIEDRQKQVEASMEAEKKEGKETVYDTDVKKSVIIPYEYGRDSVYAKFSGGLACAATNYLCYINSDGEKEWEMTTSVIDPIISVADNYILIAQNGGKKLCLYDNKRLVYDTDCEENILTANVSEKGDCVLVTSKDLYKGAIYAYNKNGQKIYGWSSGSDSVLSAAISSSSRNIAATLLNTDKEIISSVQIFDITKTKPIATTKYADTVLFDVRYFSDTVCAFGDNSLIGVKSNGKTLYDLRFDSSPISHYSIDRGRKTLVAMDSDNVPALGIFKDGGQKKTLTVSEMPDYIDIGSGHILYNMGRDVILSRQNGSGAKKYTAAMDVRKLILVGSDTFFIAYSNSVELVKF